LFNHRTGYSIGIGFPPGWGEGQIMDIKPNDPRPLEAGMTFHLTPALFIPDVAGPGFSETVLVTESGAEPLTTFPREFIIK
ncbi:MAG: M24 family metallopeptidase, partial [Dehalococcoidia bacterium]